MPRLSRLCLCLLVGGSLLVAGCQKFNMEKDFDVENGESKFFTIDAFQSDKQVTVSATAASAPITVAIVSGGEPDEKTLARNLDKVALANSGKPAKEITLTADVKGKQNFTICVLADKKTKVHLKVTSN